MDKYSAKFDQSIHRLFDITPIPTVVTSVDGGLEYTNPALHAFLGYSRKELMSSEVVITHPEDLRINKKVRAQLMENPTQSVQVPKRYLHKDGHSIPALLNMAAEVDEYGNACRFLSQIVDLSGVRQSQAAELLLDQLVQKSHDAIYVVDREFGQILNCNELGYKRLGYTKQELLKLTVPDINPMFSKNLTWGEHVRNMKQSPHQFVEATHRRKDGSELPIEANVSMVEFNGEYYLLAIVRDISERKVREQQVIEAQNLDPLTNLPNRRLLNAKLESVVSESSKRLEKLAFMYLDIDNFKQLNDHYGHAVGDQVLVCLASRLRDFTRQSDLVARLGGDEFLIVLPGLNSQEHVLGIANHILQVVSHPILLPNGEEIKPALSLGATLCFSFDLDLSDAISTADKAMYQAKKQAGSSSHYISSKNYPF